MRTLPGSSQGQVRAHALLRVLWRLWLVAFSCKGRGFCPSCMGRRMNVTAANLIERVLPPQTGLRQWVLTFPFAWRRRLAQDGALFGSLTRIFVETVQTFCASRAAKQGQRRAKTGAVSAAQRTSPGTWLP